MYFSGVVGCFEISYLLQIVVLIILDAVLCIRSYKPNILTLVNSTKTNFFISGLISCLVNRLRYVIPSEAQQSQSLRSSERVRQDICFAPRSDPRNEKCSSEHDITQLSQDPGYYRTLMVLLLSREFPALTHSTIKICCSTGLDITRKNIHKKIVLTHLNTS